MSVIMHDAVASLPDAARQAYDKGDLADLVYADDTLLIGASSIHLQSFLLAVEKAGKYFGLELHSGKFQLLQIGHASTYQTLMGHLSFLLPLWAI